MNKYEQGKQKTRQLAQEIQNDQAPKSWGQVANDCERLQRLAKRYGLIKELHNEGII